MKQNELSQVFSNASKDEIWLSVRKGVENGVIKNYLDATKAAQALLMAYRVIYKESSNSFVNGEELTEEKIPQESQS